MSSFLSPSPHPSSVLFVLLETHTHTSALDHMASRQNQGGPKPLRNRNPNQTTLRKSGPPALVSLVSRPDASKLGKPFRATSSDLMRMAGATSQRLPLMRPTSLNCKQGTAWRTQTADANRAAKPRRSRGGGEMPGRWSKESRGPNRDESETRALNQGRSEFSSRWVNHRTPQGTETTTVKRVVVDESDDVSVLSSVRSGPNSRHGRCVRHRGTKPMDPFIRRKERFPHQSSFSSHHLLVSFAGSAADIPTQAVPEKKLHGDHTCSCETFPFTLPWMVR